MYPITRKLYFLVALAALIFSNAAINAADLDKQDAAAGGIVSVGGSITEIIYALGQSDRLVAVDVTSRFPAETAQKPNVGYMRQLSAEPILAMEPQMLIAVEDAGPPAVFDQLKSAGLHVVMVPDAPSPEGVLEKIDRVAAALDQQKRGQALRSALAQELELIADVIDPLSDRPRVLFLLSIGNGGAPLAAGRQTSAASIISMAGGVNAIDAYAGYKPLSPEATIEAAPDVVLVTKRSLRLLGGEAGLLSLPEIAETPAGQNRQIVAMDGLLLLGFGPRTGTAAKRLANRLHPNVALEVTSK